MGSSSRKFSINSMKELLVSLCCLSEEPPNSDILRNPRNVQLVEIELYCEKWRISAETSDLGGWDRVRPGCGEYVKEYMTMPVEAGMGYEVDVGKVWEEAGMYARSVELNGDGKDGWVFDVDETLLSNLPYYARHGFGSETFDSMKFNEWMEMGMAPAIPFSLKLYEEVLNMGFAVILLTGRSDRHRSVTMDNLYKAGFHGWRKLIMRSPEDHGINATEFKSNKRKELMEEGYRILGNSGDQWSDLLGSSVSQRSFKLSNPMYYIS